MPDPRPQRIPQTRGDAVRDWLATRNATTRQIARKFFAPTDPGGAARTPEKKASRWLCKQRRRRGSRRLPVRGSVLVNDTGRPDLVYGRPCPQQFLEHEVSVTELELLIGRFDRRRRIGMAEPDGLFIVD